MKRLFFCVCTTLCFLFVCNSVIGMRGIYSTHWEPHYFPPDFYFHPGVDIYEGDSTNQPLSGQRGTLRAPFDGYVLYDLGAIQATNWNAGVEMQSGSVYFGAGHSASSFDDEMIKPPTPLPNVTLATLPYAMSGSHLAQLDARVQLALCYGYLEKHNFSRRFA